MMLGVSDVLHVCTFAVCLCAFQMAFCGLPFKESTHAALNSFASALFGVLLLRQFGVCVFS